MALKLLRERERESEREHCFEFRLAIGQLGVKIAWIDIVTLHTDSK